MVCWKEKDSKRCDLCRRPHPPALGTDTEGWHAVSEKNDLLTCIVNFAL